MTVEYFILFAGLIVFVWRLRAKPLPIMRQDESPHSSSTVSSTVVSIIIPCRDEEENLQILLPSLLALKGVQTEIIIVDDASSDRTLEIAKGFDQVRVLSAPEKPPGWVGKSWACWQGSMAASGEYLLFTDADTYHRPDSLQRALSFALHTNADLVSAPPFHRAKLRFENLLGLFYILPLIATAYQSQPKTTRLFAIGQYFLVKRSAYETCDGHKAIRSDLVDDLALAQHFLDRNHSYRVYPRADLFEVQMYQSWRSFCLGWKRILRLGSRRTSITAFIETLLVINLFATMYTHPNIVSFIALIFLAVTQRHHGAFAVWGVLLAPFNILLFIILSVLGALESLSRRKVVWRGRYYPEA